mgnify:CR=1 FL=1
MYLFMLFVKSVRDAFVCHVTKEVCTRDRDFSDSEIRECDANITSRRSSRRSRDNDILLNYLRLIPKKHLFDICS